MKTPNPFELVADVLRGAAYTGATYQMKYDKKLQRKRTRAANERADKCTPCAASAYVSNLQKTFGGGK